jgi:hypothetical protein
MSILDSLRLRVASLFRRPQISAETEEELSGHIHHRADDLERSGLARAEAERRARVEFGGYAKYKEQSYEATGSHFVETLGKDLRFSVRTLRKSPGFAIAAIGTLALAIGANAVVFSILNAFILRPLNVSHPETLWALFRQPDNDASESYPDFHDLRERSTRSFESVMAYNIGQVALDTGSDPSEKWVEEASGNYFDALGIQPYLGRLFHDSDEHGAKSAPLVVLTYAFWQSHFQRAHGVVGRVVQLNKHLYTILGVAQPGFHGTLIFFNPDFFTPLVNDPELGGDGLEQRGKRWIFMVMGHLRPGVTPAQATADLNSTGVYLEKTYPKDEPKMTFVLNRPNLYGDFIGKPARQFLTGLLLLAGLILLAACANLGSLFGALAAGDTGGGGEKHSTATRRRIACLHRNPIQAAGRVFLRAAYGDAGTWCAGNDGRDVVANRHLRHSCVLGEQTAARAWDSHGARRAAQGGLAGCVGTAAQTAGAWFRCGIDPGSAGERRARSHRRAGYTPSPLLLAGVVLAMGMLGLVATRIPAQRALSVNPLTSLREE